MHTHFNSPYLVMTLIHLHPTLVVNISSIQHLSISKVTYVDHVDKQVKVISAHVEVTFQNGSFRTVSDHKTEDEAIASLRELAERINKISVK